jgi:mannose-1-phosphate guanylyltransferase
MISVHADWAIANTGAFRDALKQAARAAESTGGLVTVGIVPDRPETGLGYVQPGPEVSPGVWRVAEFVEKPPRARAEELVAKGALWNSGIFAWHVGAFLSEIAAHSPEVGPALARNPRSLRGFFAAVRTPIAVDHAILERSTRVFVMRGEFGWDDVGTWAALHRVRARDASGNAAVGDAYLQDSAGNVVHAEGHQVVLYGVEDLVVVARDGLTLVTTRERSADLKRLVESLPAKVRAR